MVGGSLLCLLKILAFGGGGRLVMATLTSHGVEVCVLAVMSGNKICV